MSSSLHGEDASTHPRDQCAPPSASPLSDRLSPVAWSPIEGFVSELNQSLKTTEKLLSQVCRTSIEGEPLWRTGDPRVVNIQLAQRNKVTAERILRRGLGQRSFAIEYEEWEKRTFKTSRVIEWTVISKRPTCRGGHIQEFMNANRDRFCNHSTIKEEIRHGIKLLVCEALLRETGISAILIFHHTAVRGLRYRDLQNLKHAIKGADAIMRVAEQNAE